MVKTLTFTEAMEHLSLPGFNRNLFSSADWLSVLDKTYALKLYVNYIEREGKLDSYIIYSVVKNFLEWKVCICSYCDYFDCHVKDVNDWQLLFDALRKMYPHYRIAVRNLRDDIVKKLPALNVLYTEKYHILDIREDIDAIWDKTHASFKSPVKQAQKFDLTIKRCAKSELPKFYNLHLNLRKN